MPSAATMRHSMTLTTSAEKNMNGARVRVASCDCGDGWLHMTAYRLGRRKQADKYLERRWIDHVFPEGGYV